MTHLLSQVHPDGKFVVDLDKSIEMSQVTPNLRVALRNDSYVLHKILPSKVCTRSYLARYVQDPTLQGQFLDSKKHLLFSIPGIILRGPMTQSYTRYTLPSMPLSDSTHNLKVEIFNTRRGPYNVLLPRLIPWCL